MGQINSDFEIKLYQFYDDYQQGLLTVPDLIQKVIQLIQSVDEDDLIDYLEEISALKYFKKQKSLEGCISVIHNLADVIGYSEQTKRKSTMVH